MIRNPLLSPWTLDRLKRTGSDLESRICLANKEKNMISYSVFKNPFSSHYVFVIRKDC